MYLKDIKNSKIDYILYVFIWFLKCISRWEIIPFSQWTYLSTSGPKSILTGVNVEPSIYSQHCCQFSQLDPSQQWKQGDLGYQRPSNWMFWLCQYPRAPKPPPCRRRSYNQPVSRWQVFLLVRHVQHKIEQMRNHSVW